MLFFSKMSETENQQQTVQKRQVAYKIRIKDILNGSYVKEEGWQPNYIEVNGNKVSRVNLIGIVVLKSDQNNMVLDDGSGRVPLRVFENNGFFEKVDVGDIVLLIGRPREFGSEKYVMPEIIKKIEDSGWANVRKKELKLNDVVINEVEEKAEEVKGVVEEVEGADDPETNSDKIFNFIKESDKGEGVNTEDVLGNIKEEGAEGMINKLLERGEIFEVSPGKLKVLE